MEKALWVRGLIPHWAVSSKGSLVGICGWLREGGREGGREEGRRKGGGREEGGREEGREGRRNGGREGERYVLVNY